MIMSMTGFGSKEIKNTPFGKISVELRSTNHRFLEIVSHLPDGLLAIDEKIKKEIERRLKRGRVICVINIVNSSNAKAFINRQLLKKYITELRHIQTQERIKDEARIDTLMHLPGVLSLVTHKVAAEKVWPHVKVLVKEAMDRLVLMRKKEGLATHLCLKNMAQGLKFNLGIIKIRFKKVIQEKAARIAQDEERVRFLKDTDITEEMERLTYHTRNFSRTLYHAGSIGKELDFIAQEMQREANTMSAKSCDVLISARLVKIKSQIEKIREQVQNVE